jgi:hypothetical protein
MVLTTQVPYTPNLDADTCGFWHLRWGGT